MVAASEQKGYGARSLWLFNLYEEWDSFAFAENIVSGGMISAGLATTGLVAHKLPKLAFIAIEALEEYGRYMPPLP